MSETVLDSNDVDSVNELMSRGDAFVGAVHSLVTSTRSASKFDLVLAASSHLLRGGDKVTAEIRAAIDKVWPGARVDDDVVREALLMGVELGLVHETEALDGPALWGLTGRGLEDVEHHTEWAGALRERAATELRQRATNDLGVAISSEQSELWLERLVAALIFGITSSQDAYLGRVDRLVSERLTPRRVDRETVLAQIDRGNSDPAVIEFLKTAAIAALDPLDPFCAELVSHITTGCVLHSYVAGREAAPVLERLGSPGGQRALLDTPVLLELIGPRRVRETVETALRAAVSAGWEVIVCDHSLEELSRLLKREIPAVKASFSQAHQKGIKNEWLASLSDNQLTSYAVEVLRDGTYKTLDAMLEASARLRVTLKNLGVNVRHHFNEGDISSVAKCREALNIALEGSHRSEAVMQRDADSMAVIWRRRRREKPGSAWPGGWIITPDRHLAAAFSSVDRFDSVPISLSVAQWATLLSVTVAPTDVVSLAEAAATQLVEESMWLLPTRYPSDVALELAERLSSTTGDSGTEVRFAQLTLDLALDHNKDHRTATAVAGDILSARTSRRERFAQLEVERASRAVAEARAESLAASELVKLQSKEIKTVQSEVQTKEAALADVSSELAWHRDKVQRMFWSFCFILFGLGALFGAFVLNAWLPVTIAMAVALLFGVYVLIQWCSDPESKVTRLVWAGLVEGLGLASALAGLVPGFPWI